MILNIIYLKTLTNAMTGSTDVNIRALTPLVRTTAAAFQATC